MRIFLNKKAFTLIEVLGVLAIISILFILIIPNVSSALEKTKETTVLSTFKDYELAIQHFFLDENDFSDDLSNFNEYLSKNLQFENNVSKKTNSFGYPYVISVEDYNKVKITTKKNDKDDDNFVMSVIKLKNNIDTYYVGFSDEKINSEYEYLTKTFNFTNLTSNKPILELDLEGILDVEEVVIDNGKFSVISKDNNKLKLQISNASPTSQKLVSGVFIPYAEKEVVAYDSPNYSDSENYKGILTKYLYSGAVSVSKQVSEKKIYSTESSIPSNISYNSDGYKGTLNKSGSSTKVVTSGSASVSKTVSQVLTKTSNSFASTLPYNDDTYLGTLNRTNVTSSVVDTVTSGYWQDTGYWQDSGYWQDTGYWGTETIWGTIPNCTPLYFSDECDDIKTVSKWISTGSAWVSTGSAWVSTGSSWVDTSYTVYNYTATYSGTVSTSDTRVYGFEQEYSGTVQTPDTSVWKYKGTVVREESDTRIYQPLYNYNVTVNYKKSIQN